MHLDHQPPGRGSAPQRFQDALLLLRSLLRQLGLISRPLGTCARSEFQAGTIVLFIRWRGGAARRRISFWHLPWPPSYGVDVTAGGLHRQGDGSRTCARSEIPGWHDRALYPLAGRRRAPPDFFLAFAMAAELRGRRHRRRLAPAR